MRWIEFTDLVWPTLEAETDDEKRKASDCKKHDIDTIQSATINADEDVLIEEARRLADAEQDRRKITEGKAAVYLAFVGVLAPILATIVPDAIRPGTNWVKPMLTLVLFIGAGAYLFRCGRWAFKAIKVGASSHLDAVDLARSWNAPDHKAALARDILKCVRLNRAGVNDKVTAIKLAHEHATRALLAFVAALLVRSGWEPVAKLFAVIGKVLNI